MTPAQPNPLLCPHCQQIDQVLKVTAVVSGGAAAGVFAAPMSRGRTMGYAAVPGASQTVQSMRLAPPKELRFRSAFGCLTLLMLAVAFAVLISSFAIVIFVSILLFNGVGYGSDAVNLLNSLVTDNSLAKGLFVIVIGVLILLVPTLAFIRRIVSLRREDVSRYSQFKVDHQQWERAMEKWNTLYYCGRCDGVFLPGGASGFVPTNGMGAFLYS